MSAETMDLAAARAAIESFADLPPEGVDFDALATRTGWASEVLHRAHRIVHATKAHGGPRPNGRADTGKHADDAARTITAVTLADFLARELPPREYVLEPVIPAQGLVMIAGARGIAKTFVGLGLGYAVATGSGFQKWKAPQPRRVLYLDGEMPAAAKQERLAALVHASEALPPDDEHFRLVTPDLQADLLPDLTSEEGQRALAPHVAAADLVILDNLSTLCRSGKENEAESWVPVQEWLLGLRRAGKSLVLIHHTGKNGLQRGTSKREDVLDTVLLLRRPGDYLPSQGARFEVHLDKGRGITGDDAAPFEAMLELRDGKALWTIRSLADVELATVVRLTAEGVSVRDIAEETGFSRSKVSRLQKKAKESGTVVPFPKGGRHFDGSAADDD